MQLRETQNGFGNKIQKRYKRFWSKLKRVESKRGVVERLKWKGLKGVQEAVWQCGSSSVVVLVRLT